MMNLSRKVCSLTELQKSAPWYSRCSGAERIPPNWRRKEMRLETDVSTIVRYNLGDLGRSGASNISTRR